MYKYWRILKNKRVATKDIFTPDRKLQLENLDIKKKKNFDFEDKETNLQNFLINLIKKKKKLMCTYGMKPIEMTALYNTVWEN